ncbi:BRCA1-associated ATM activator 1-like [Mercenaria mercenaria]|uniref:BRCA1-associated ATM activator 1-like n=1 Tax=Mercenaria mercenaria TaxID=6596 RepID=UPI00234E5711|nr:BRCA1-associated ATM activator 1-like [Mercenaria mercenaria]
MSAPVKKSGNDVVIAVKKVTDYLLKGNKVIDDTVIHSLFDSIKLSFDSIGDIEKVELQKFVEDVAKNCTELDSCTVVFSLEVTGWLGGNNVYYGCFKSSIHQVFHAIWEKLKSKDLCDISVTTALYESLAPLAKHEEGLQWIVGDKEIADVTTEGLGILRGSSSIFLEKAVIRYLTSVMVALEVECENNSAGHLFSSRLLDTTASNIENSFCKKHVGPFVPGSLQLLENLCRLSPGTSKQLLTNHIDFCKHLLDMIGSLNPRNCDTVLNIIGALLQTGLKEDSCMDIRDNRDHFIRKIEDQLSHLAAEGNIVDAQKLAVCCLKSQGTVRLEQSCKTILIQPVNWILEEDVECSIFPQQVLQTALSTKCRCTDIVCRSLNGNTIGVNTITGLLRRSIVFSGHGDRPCSMAASYVYKNRKIQRKCLETLITCTQNDRKDEDSGWLTRAELVVELFREPDNETVIYSLCSQLLLNWLPLLCTDENAMPFTVVLAQTIQCHLSALQWELRDTTLELLSRIIEQYKDNTSVTKWIIEHRLHVQIWQCVKDGESYVRASAISALYQLCLCPQLLSALTKSGLVSDEADVIEAITDIVENDTEAFARRSAVTFLLKVFKVKVSSKVRATSDVQDSSDGILDNVIATIVKATRDFDWEVKLIALDVVSFVIQQELSQWSKILGMPDYAKDLYNIKSADKSEPGKDMSHVIDGLCRNEIVSVLIDALDDYDEKVCEKAFKVFSDLQSLVKTITDPFENEDNDLIDTCGMKKRKLDDMYRTGTTDTKQDNDTNRLLSLEFRTDNFEKGVKNFRHLAEVSSVANNRNEILGENTTKKNDNIRKILDFDLSVYKSRIEQVNDGAAKLLSLVEDILTAADKEDDENAVDCY